MTRYVLRRALWIVVTLLVVVTFTFLLTFLIPADPARTIVGPKGTPEEVAFVRQKLGLDDSIAVQYGRYLGHVVQLDLGYSYSQRRPVSDVILERLPWTILLACAALFVQLAIGIPLGLLTAARANDIGDRVALGWALVTVALPGFWVGLVLLYLFAYRWPVFPLGGSDLPLALVLPALTLGLAGAAWYSRVMRAATLEVLDKDFVRALRAKGCSPRAILLKHAFRAAFSPLLTMIAIDFGFFLGGAVLVESVFGWPGLGLTAWEAMQENDVQLLMGCVIFGAIFVLVMNLLADAARTIVDPRVRIR